MMPGMRGMNPKQMEQMMKRMGMKEIKAEKVIIRTEDGKIVIKEPSVSVIEMQGQRTYTITGIDKKIKGRSKRTGAEDDAGGAAGGADEEAEEAPTEDAKVARFTEEDVRLVAEQANVSEEKARKALEECDGAPAEAIILLMGG